MKQAMRMFVLAAFLGGCATLGVGLVKAGPPQIGCGEFGRPVTVPGVQGPWGTPVTMAAPYSALSPGEQAAYQMMSQSVPLSYVQGGVVQAGLQVNGGMPGLMPPGGGIAPPGVPMTPGAPAMGPPPGAVAAAGAITGQARAPFAAQRTEVLFTQPMDMKVSWFGPSATGAPGAVAGELTVRGRYNFIQGGIYRLKLSNIPNYPSLDLYPTLEVVPGNLKTAAFLAHSAVPLSFTEEDFAQVVAGNFVVKVIYLPDPQFQELAATAPGEIVSTALPPGVDPVAEAATHGSILLVVRLGNIDLEAKNTPPMNAPNPYCATPAASPRGPMPPPGARSGIMVPYGMQNSGQPLIMGPGLQPLQMTPQGPVPMGDNAGQFLPPTMPTPAMGPTSKANTDSASTTSAVQQTAGTITADTGDNSSKASSSRSGGFLRRLFGHKSEPTDTQATMMQQPTP